ncbi:MAG: MBL fold metallo-hydrolase [Haloferacaceae archaeon]
MGASDWGDWLPRSIARADPETVAVWYLGCNGVVLKGSGGTTVFVDPYCGLGDPPRLVRMIPVPFNPADVTDVDAVFATHEHSDHVHGPTQGPLLSGTDAPYYAPDASLAVVAEEDWTTAYDLDDDRFREVRAGETVAVGEFDVTVVEVNDPDAAHPVGYVFDHDAGTVFHGGDTRPADSFADLGSRRDLDLGVVAFGTVGRLLDPGTGGPARKRWYCDENQAVEVANSLQLDRLLPTHWDVWKGLTADPTALHHHARSFDFPRRLEIAEIGDRVDL